MNIVELLDEFKNNVDNDNIIRLYVDNVLQTFYGDFDTFMPKIIGRLLFVKNIKTLPIDTIKKIIDYYVKSNIITLFSSTEYITKLICIDKHIDGYFLLKYITNDTAMYYVRNFQHPTDKFYYKLYMSCYKRHGSCETVNVFRKRLNTDTELCKICGTRYITRSSCQLNKKILDEELKSQDYQNGSLMAHLCNIVDGDKDKIGIIVNAFFKNDGVLCKKRNIIYTICNRFTSIFNYAIENHNHYFLTLICNKNGGTYNMTYDADLRAKFVKNGYELNSSNFIQYFISADDTFENCYEFSIKTKIVELTDIMTNPLLYSIAVTYISECSWDDHKYEIFYYALSLLRDTDVGKISKRKLLKNELCSKIYQHRFKIITPPSPINYNDMIIHDYRKFIEFLNRGDVVLTDELCISLFRHNKWSLRKISKLTDIYKNYKLGLSVIKEIDNKYNFGLYPIVSNVVAKKKNKTISVTNQIFDIDASFDISTITENIIMDKYIISDERISKLLNINVGIIIDLDDLKKQLNK